MAHDHFDPTGPCWCRGFSVTNLVEVLRPCIRQEVEEGLKLQDQRFEKALKRVILPYLPSLQNSGLPSTSRSLPNQAESPVSALFTLHFVGIFPDTLFTYTDIEIDGTPLQVELHDSSGSRVEDGPMSSAKVKILALFGDLEEDNDVWTGEDYNKNSVKQRKDKGALLGGDYEIRMSKGVAVFSNIRFTDNSKWTRSGTFKLGVVVKGLPSGVVVKGAVSKAFKVKERRTLACRKHKTPSLEDEVWHLVNIGKNGRTHQSLANENVKTVKDLLQLYRTNPKKLRNILQVPEKKWTDIVKHAGSCLGTGSSENCMYKDVKGNIELLLDGVPNVIGGPFKGQIGQSYGILDDSQKVDTLDHIGYEKRSVMPKTDSLTNQKSGQAELIYSSTIIHANSECTPFCASSSGQAHATAADHGEQLLPVNSSPGLMQYTVEQHAGMYQPGAPTCEMADFDLFPGEDFWVSSFGNAVLADSTPQPEERHAGCDSSANKTATSKLRVACYVKLAATVFTIPVQQDPTAPRKKQKIQC